MPEGPLECAALAPGLWRLTLPFPSPLRYSCSYLLRVSAGFVVIDTGWNTDEGWELFQAGLARAGGNLDQLCGVVATHAHPDHYGLTARVREHCDAWIGLHPGERAMLAPFAGDREQRVEDISRWIDACGVSTVGRDAMLSDRAALLGDFSANLPTLDLGHGDVVPDTDGSIVVIHTPGHTPGHLVFHDRERGVLFTGDHLLPRVSVNVSLRPTSDADPLGDYHASLDELTPYADELAAPGHEWTFDRIGRRLDEVRAHHRSRLNEVLQAVRDGAGTPWLVARTITWARPFETLNSRGQRAALGEAAAHLSHLERLGRVERRDGGVLAWRSKAPGH